MGSITDLILEQIMECKECKQSTTRGSRVSLCGWHEDVVAGILGVTKLVHNADNVPSATDGD